MEKAQVKLTQFSHGAGCGCKIAPGVLDQILGQLGEQAEDPRLVVGHGARDDAAVYDLGDGTAAVSTTDFFMPIVDDPLPGRWLILRLPFSLRALGGRLLCAELLLGRGVGVLGRPLEPGRGVGVLRVGLRAEGVSLAYPGSGIEAAMVSAIVVARLRSDGDGDAPEESEEVRLAARFSPDLGLNFHVNDQEFDL